MTRIGEWWPIECVCFPRSGHKLVSDWLSHYFGAEFICDGDYSGPDWRPGVHFQKNHDFELQSPIQADRRYLVMTRDPHESFYSWMRLTADADGILCDEETLKEIARTKLTYWAEFSRRWVYSRVPNRLITHYQDLVEQPFEALSAIVQFCGETPDSVRVGATLEKIPAARRRWSCRVPDSILTYPQTT